MKKLHNKFIIKFIVLFLLLSSHLSFSLNAESSQDIDSILANMSQKEKIGQLIMLDLRQWQVDGIQDNLTTMNTEVENLIADYKLGGVILFKENIIDIEQTLRLTNAMQNSVSNDIPLFLATDQEGGLVTRFKAGTIMPGNMALGASRDLDLTRDVAKAIGEEIFSLGINLNFAPSVDINSNFQNPVIGVRSFGSDPDLVSEMGQAYISGLHKANVAAAAKHFPGHGDTDLDTHVCLTVLDKSLEDLMANDLKPFFAAVAADVDMLMTAHIVVPALDDSKIILANNREMPTPATLSKKILSNFVRGQMQYEGVIITDALNMQAISNQLPEADAVVKALAAGVDIVLMPTSIQKPSDIKKLDNIYSAIDDAVAKGVFSQNSLDESVYRVLRLKKKQGLFNSDDKVSIDKQIEAAKGIIASTSHKEIEYKAASKAITLIKNEEGTLPFQLENKKNILIFSTSNLNANLMMEQLNKMIKNKSLVDINVESVIYNPNIEAIDVDKDRLINSDFIIVETSSLNKNSRYAASIIKYANEMSSKLVVISSQNPYDLMYLEDTKANIAVYGSSIWDQTQNKQASATINLAVGLEVIFGDINPKGKLPVFIPNLNNETMYDFGHGLSYGVATNYDNLIQVINKAKQVNDELYTEASYEDLNNKILIGEDVIKMLKKDEMSVNQDKVDALSENLIKAINNLEEIKEIDNYLINNYIPVILGILGLLLLIILLMKKRRSNSKNKTNCFNKSQDSTNQLTN